MMPPDLDDEENIHNGNTVMKAGGGEKKSFSRYDSDDMDLFEEKSMDFPFELDGWKKVWICRGIMAIAALYVVLEIIPSSNPSSSSSSASSDFSPGASPGTEIDCSSLGVNDAIPSECLPFAGIDVEGYDEWYDANKIGIKYQSSMYMPSSDPAAPENGAAIHWKVEGEYVHLAVAARSTGWVGFGLAEAGGMVGADMVLFEARNPNVLIDAFTDDMKYPQIDECSNDWEFIDSNIDNERGFIMFETKRLLDTNDTQDRRIMDDTSTFVAPHRVIAAWGDSASFGHHGLNRSRGAIRFHSQEDELAAFRASMDRSAEGNFEIRSGNHKIQPKDTGYARPRCISRDDMISSQNVPEPKEDGGKFHIVGFEPVLHGPTKVYVHHLFVFGHTHENCQGEGSPAYIWAPGEGPLALPDNLGSPLFGEDGYQSFSLQIHYNNPKKIPGLVDNSGIRFHWTSRLRDEEMGMLVVGHELGHEKVAQPVFGTNVGKGLTRHEFELPGSCTSLIPQPLTVLREFLHMHGYGVRASNQIIRRDEVVHTGSIDYWDFEQSATTIIHQDPFIMNPGDSVKVNCFFNAEEDNPVFGGGAGEEMCVSFMYYYPKTTKILCSAMHTATKIKDQSEFDRTFGIPQDQCM